MTDQHPVSPSVRAAAVTKLRRRLDAAPADGTITVSVSMLGHVIAEHDDAKRRSNDAINTERAERQQNADELATLRRQLDAAEAAAPPAPREREDAIHHALHDLGVRIPGLPGDCHCNLITQVVLDAQQPQDGPQAAPQRLEHTFEDDGTPETPQGPQRGAGDVAASGVRLRSAVDEANRGAGRLAMQILKRVTTHLENCGADMINVRQVLGLLSPTWPDGNYEERPPASDATENGGAR